mmetsp:Transcript_111004/g.310174  ORF Transcript_111004/g.310174 Transcript_111004/m.310174 type:complete len:258 (+) Transcript_111004:181-954(+)
MDTRMALRSMARPPWAQHRTCQQSCCPAATSMQRTSCGAEGVNCCHRPSPGARLCPSMCAAHDDSAPVERPTPPARAASQSPRSAKTNLSRICSGTNRFTSFTESSPGSMLKSSSPPRNSGYKVAISTIARNLRINALDPNNLDHLKPWQSRASTTFTKRPSRMLWLWRHKLRISTEKMNHSSTSDSEMPAISCNSMWPSGSRDTGEPSAVPAAPGSCNIFKWSTMAPCGRRSMAKSSMSGGRRARATEIVAAYFRR